MWSSYCPCKNSIKKNDISLYLFESYKELLLKMKHTFSRGLNVTGRVKLVPELKTIGLGYSVVKNLLDGDLKNK